MDTREALPLTLDVRTWGRLVLGIGENASYDAARRGDILIIRLGEEDRIWRRIRVPVRANLLRLANNDPTLLDALTNDLLAKLREKPTVAA
jgi:hypothetical protein